MMSMPRLVCPHLEYCCTVKNLYTRKEITKIENIQHCVARFVSNKFGQWENMSAMINNLQWDTLEKRRQISCLLLMYRIHTQQIAINGNCYLAPILLNSTRYYHPNKYQIFPARIQVYRNSFFPRTVIWWNALPGNVLVAPTFEAFRGAVTTQSQI